MKGLLTIVVVTIALFGASICQTGGGQWEVEVSAISVKQPSRLAQSADAAIANFGTPMYGAQLSGTLGYVEDNADACKPFTQSFGSDETARATGLPVLALVNRGGEGATAAHASLQAQNSSERFVLVFDFSGGNGEDGSSPRERATNTQASREGCPFLNKALNAQAAGAHAIIVVDSVRSELLTMAKPESEDVGDSNSNDVLIPAVMITNVLGIELRRAVNDGETVVVELDWSEAIPHGDERVEWELWHTSSPACGEACDDLASFIKNIAPMAKELDKEGATRFVPHWSFNRGLCFGNSTCLREQCIRGGRYCSSGGFGEGFRNLKPWQVVIEDVRSMCVWNVLDQQSKGWMWWDYVTSFRARCASPSNVHFTQECAEEVMTELGVDAEAVDDCVGDPNIHADHELVEEELLQLKDEEDSGRGLVIFMPTIVINTNQYRGRLDHAAVLRAICSGFQEGTEPEACLNRELQKDDCSSATADCWQDGNFSACKDTFRGFICACPEGFEGDGKTCVDIDECAAGTSECAQHCANEVGGYTCSCDDGYMLIAGTACVPWNKCDIHNGGCEGRCIFDPFEGVSCTCGAGLKVARDGKSCEDVKECSQDPPPCSQECRELDPRTDNGQRYRCSCRDGFVPDPNDSAACISAAEFGTLVRAPAAEGTAAASSSSSGGSSGSSFSLLAILGIVLSCSTVVLLGAVGMYRLWMRRAVEHDMRSILKEYIPEMGDSSLREKLMEPVAGGGVSSSTDDPAGGDDPTANLPA